MRAFIVANAVLGLAASAFAYGYSDAADMGLAARDIEYNELYARDAEPEAYFDDEDGMTLTRRDVDSIVDALVRRGPPVYAGGSGKEGHHQASARHSGGPYHGDGIRVTHEVEQHREGGNPPKKEPHTGGLKPFYLPANKDAEPVKFHIKNGKTVRSK